MIILHLYLFTALAKPKAKISYRVVINFNSWGYSGVIIISKGGYSKVDHC